MYNPFSLSGKRVLVTGASSGIGRAIAIECSRMGAQIILTARNTERLDETLGMMDASQIHQVIPADLSSEEGLRLLVESVSEPLDGVVNCAGMAMPKPFRFILDTDMEMIMGVNFKAPAILLQQLLKRKRINKGASLVFISSIAGVWISFIGESLYSASKGAVNGLVKSMAIELAGKGIRVNSVNPGMIDTQFLKSGSITEEQLQEDAKRYPLGRYGKPEEVAYAVVYLLSDASTWMTGSNLLIDGGYTLL